MKIGDIVHVKESAFDAEGSPRDAKCGIVRQLNGRFALLTMLGNNGKHLYQTCFFYEDLVEGEL